MPVCAPPASRSGAAKYPGSFFLNSFLVNLFGRFQYRIRFHPFPLFQAFVKTALAPGMAGDAALLFNLHQYDIAVAIQPDFLHFLDMSGLFALVPQFLSRTRPIHRLTLLPGQPQCIAIHPCHHQHPPGGSILRDGCHQPVFGPVYLIQPCLIHSRTSMPCSAINCLACCTVYSPKWKMLAASTASAPPSFTPSARCCKLPTPPLAITGISSASVTARVSARSKPFFCPSRSMLVSRISPAPRCCIFFAHSTASSPVALRPP